MHVRIKDSSSPSPVVATVAVSLEITRFGAHTGFLYVHEDDSIWRCDVAWDFVARNEPAEGIGRLCWVNVELHESLLELLAAKLELMNQNKAAIPYDVRYGERSYFDKVSWQFINGDPPGLTCSTFIMATFRGIGLELFDIPSWPARQEDGEALNRLLQMLANHGKDSAIVAAQAAGHRCVRFRPEEVCGSVGHGSFPVPFGQAECAGRQVLAHAKAFGSGLQDQSAS